MSAKRGVYASGREAVLRVLNMREGAPKQHEEAKQCINVASRCLGSARIALEEEHPDRIDALDMLRVAGEHIEKAITTIRSTLPCSHVYAPLDDVCIHCGTKLPRRKQ